MKTYNVMLKKQGSLLLYSFFKRSKSKLKQAPNLLNIGTNVSKSSRNWQQAAYFKVSGELKSFTVYTITH